MKNIRNVLKVLGSKLQYIIIITVSLLIVIITPLLTDKFVFGNSIRSNISNSEWVAFLGSYIGAILGGAVSLVGIGLTIKFTADENRRERILQVLPYFNISYHRIDGNYHDYNSLDYIFFDAGENLELNQLNMFGRITIKNVGYGPAINCCVSDVRFRNVLVPRSVPTITQNAFENGKEFYIDIGSYVKKGIIDDKSIVVDREGGFRGLSSDGMKAAGAGELSFYICFNDILETQYMQKIDIRISVGAEKGIDGVWRYSPDMTLVSIGERENSNRVLVNRIVPFVVNKG